MLPVRRSNIPPPAGPEMLVVRIDADQTVVATIISRHLVGFQTHWTGNRTIPCLERKGECHGCKAGMPSRWKGYLHVWDHHRKKDVFLEMTPHSANELLEQLGAGAEMRGQRVTLKRMKGKKARVKVQWDAIHGQVASDKLPEPKDPQVTLETLWGYNVARLAGSEKPTILMGQESA